MKFDYDNNILAFIASAVKVNVHYHHCYQMVISLDNPFQYAIDGNTHTESMGFIINQAIKHSYAVPQSNILVLKMNAYSCLGQYIKKILNSKPFVDIKDVMDTTMLQTLFPKNYISLSNKQLIPHINVFLKTIFVKDDGLIQTEPEKLRPVLNFIEENIDKKITLKHAASILNLSSERTRHLFLETTQSPFLQYILWLKVRKVLAATMQHSINLFTASIQYGFTDQSHFNRTFKKLYGIAPTVLIKNARFIN